MKFSKVFLVFMFLGFVGLQTYAMDNRPACGDANENSNSGALESSRKRSLSLISGGEKCVEVTEPECKRQSVEQKICINDMSNDVLMLIFEFSSGEVKSQDYPVKSLISLMELCKTNLPVCKRWRRITLFLIKLDLEKVLGLSEGQLFSGDLKDLSENAKLIKICLAKKILDSMIHGENVVEWYKLPINWIINKFYKNDTVSNDDTNMCFKDLKQLIEAQCDEKNCKAVQSLYVDMFNSSVTHFIYPINTAAFRDQIDCWLFAIIASSKPCVCNSKGFSLLHFVTMHGDLETVSKLIESGVDVNKTVECRYHYTPNGWSDSVENYYYDLTPLKLIVKRIKEGQLFNYSESIVSVINLLIKNGARIDQDDLEFLKGKGIDFSKINPEQIVKK